MQLILLEKKSAGTTSSDRKVIQEIRLKLAELMCTD
jgi:hypothetical protein